MPVVTLQGNPKTPGGIPRNSEVEVVTLPDMTTVWRGKTSRSATLDLDRGKYMYVVTKNYPDGKTGYRYDSDPFFVDMTESEWSRVRLMEPKFAKARHVSGGGVAWSCGVIGCSFGCTSKIEIILHEGEHQNIDLAAEPQRLVEVGEGLSAAQRKGKRAKSKARDESISAQDAVYK